MEIKEETLCSFTQKGTRLQLVEICQLNAAVMLNTAGEPTTYHKFKYQVRLNRKIIHTSISEYNEKKVFATYCQNIVLKIKIF